MKQSRLVHNSRVGLYERDKDKRRFTIAADGVAKAAPLVQKVLEVVHGQAYLVGMIALYAAFSEVLDDNFGSDIHLPGEQHRPVSMVDQQRIRHPPCSTSLTSSAHGASGGVRFNLPA